ncbi:MAG: hypothetical protein OYH77_08110 [Pseudomonadota bacterium]|nr:hypothetical protein [Pseudomonadota bacterium]
MKVFNFSGQLITKALVGACLVSVITSAYASATDTRYADASATKQLIDSYFDLGADNGVAALLKKNKIVKALYQDYDKQAYIESLTHLQSFADQYPDAAIALADAIQSHWDSHYLQSYLNSYASDYGRLKFLSALSMGVGGIGLLKNPFIHHALFISNMHVLLPLAGGAGAYYLLTLYNKDNNDIPADPQSILQLATGANYYSYEEKQRDYLRRLLGVGTGLAGGKLMYRVLAGHFAQSADKPVKPVSSSTVAASHEIKTSPKNTLPQADPAVKYDGYLKLPKPKTKRTWMRYKSMFRRPFRKSDFTVIIGALLSYYAIEKASYFALHNMTVVHTRAQLKNALYKLRDAVKRNNDDEKIIAAARQVSDLTIQLATVQEVEHLHSIATYEQELSKPANELAQIGSEVLKKITALSEKLPKRLPQPQQDEKPQDQQAMQDIVAGKLASGIDLFQQVGQVFAVLAADVSYLRFYRDRMLAKHTHLVAMYQNVAKIKEQSINWQNKFSTEELQGALEVYLAYHQADAAANLPQRRQQQKIMTSTRAYARFLGERIASSDTKTYNEIILQILSLYDVQPRHREALATLISDIDDLADLRDKSIIISGIEGAAIGAGVLIAARMLGGLADELKLLNNAIGIRRFLQVQSFKHLGYAAAVGSATAIAWHLLRSLAKRKMPAQESLFEVQKIVAYNLSFNTCVLLRDVRDNITSAQHEPNTEEIQAERKKLASQVENLNTIAAQANHLSAVAPQLRVAHPVESVKLFSQHKECSLLGNQRAVSLTTIADDLKAIKSIITTRLRALNAIEKKRLTTTE